MGDLIGGFRPETTNPATAALGQVGKGLDLWDGLQYGTNPTAYTPPASAPMQGYRPPAPQGFGGVGGLGGGLWDGLSFGTGATAFSVGAGPDLFGGFQQAKQAADQSRQQQQARDQAAAAFGGGKGATGADPNTDQWRTLIDEAAAQYGIDGDAIQAIMMIESQGNASARSGVGAMGLMQVMPFHFQPGEDGMDPRTNVMKGAQILADNYKRYGNWDSAVAAYLGAVDANGNPTTATDMYGTSGIKYAQMFNDNLQRIKAARTQRQSAPGGGGDPGGTAPPDLEAGIGRARTLLGLPYTMEGIRNTGNPQDGVDCSSFVGWALNLPRGIWNAQAEYNNTQRVGFDQMQRGDLVFFQGTYDTGRGEVVTHVGIYLGRDQSGNPIMINAASNGVEYANLNDPYWKAHYYGSGRIAR